MSDHINVENEIKGRYVPPHQRNDGSKNRKLHRTEPVKQNRRCDLSQRSKFNTRSEVAVKESPKVIKNIEVPSAITPPIVKGPSSIDSGNKQKSLVEIPRIVPSVRELQLIETLSDLRLKERLGEKDKWINHYEKELSDMYGECVDPKLDIPFEDFIQTAYECTNSEYGEKSYKRCRPLV